MLTRVAQAFVALGLGLLLVGLVFGDFAVVLAATLPMLLVLAGGSLGAPHDIAVERSEAGAPLHLEVTPRVLPVKRIRSLLGYARAMFPESDLARTGTPTTEFRELRDYVRGDPPRSINWKATARRQAGIPLGQGHGRALPLVHEY